MKATLNPPKIKNSKSISLIIMIFIVKRKNIVKEKMYSNQAPPTKSFITENVSSLTEEHLNSYNCYVKTTTETINISFETNLVKHKLLISSL